MNSNVKKIIFFGFLFLIADQFLKIVLSSKLVLDKSYLLIKNLLYLNLTYNTGAAFGLFQGGKIFLIIIAIFAIIVICFMASGEEILSDSNIFTYSLLVGGILGNMIDRIIHGYVIDYLSITIGKLNFPVFIPDEYQVKGFIFTDYGILGDPDVPKGQENAAYLQKIGSGWRTSAGFGIYWNTPMGPMNFSWGWPLKIDENDKERRFLLSFETQF